MSFFIILMQYIAQPERGTLEWVHLEATIERLASVPVKMNRDSR